MVENKDITWIYSQIQRRHDQALGLEKSLLHEILGLFQTAPKIKDKAYDEARKQVIRQNLGKIIFVFAGHTGHYPAAILAEPAAFVELVSDHECAYRDQSGEYRWGTHGIPLRKICSGDRGIYLFDEQTPVMVLPKED